MKPPQSVSDIRFNVIGQQPQLLQRISAPTADIQMHDDSDADSRSPSPDLEHELLPTSPELKGTSRPSLRARLALDSLSTSTSQPQSLESNSEQSMRQSRNAQRASTENLLPRIESKAPDSTSFDDKSAVSIAPFASRAQFSSASSGSSSLSDTTKKSMISQADQSATATQIVLAKTLPSSTANTGDIATIDSLKGIQVRLTSTAENLNPVDTETALALARSVKEKCSEMHSSARDAHMHAESALQSAQKSMDAARRCLEVAASLQTHTDDVITSIDKLSQTSPSREGGNWNTTLDALKQDLRTLSQWTQKREAEDARLRFVVEEKAVLRTAHTNKVLQNRTNSNINKSTNPVDSSLPPNFSNAANSPPSLDVDEDETAREWNRLREQNETEMKAIEEKLQRHKQEEAILEQKRAHALAEAEAQKAELTRRQAERSEFERQLQIQQMREAELAEKLRIKQEEAQRKANEERLAQTEEVKNQSSRLQAEKEKQVRLKIEQEKAQALEKRRLEEEERMQRLKKEQELKRLQIAETKRHSAAETAKEINASRQSLKSHDLNSDTRTVPFVTASTSPDDAMRASGISNKSNKTEARTSPVVKNHKNLRDVIDTSTGPSSPSESRVNNHTYILKPLTSQPLVPVMGSTQKSKAMDTSSLPHKPEPFVTSSTHTVSVNSPGTPKPGRLPSLPTPALIGKDRSPVAQHAKKASLSSSVQPRTAVLPLKPETNRSDILVLSQGKDTGNIPYVPQSRILPISPEAQRANLRNLMPDVPQPKQNSVDIKPIVKVEGQCNAPMPSKSIPVSVQRDNFNMKSSSIDLAQKLKVEPVDIPLLSIPSLNQPTAQHDNFQSPHVTAFDERAKERRNKTPSGQAVQDTSPNPTTLAQPSYPVKAKVNANGPESAHKNSAGISGHRDTQSALMSSLPSRPVLVPTVPHMRTRSMPDVVNMPRNNYFNEFDGMGNDPSITSGWNQPNEDEDISVRRSPEESNPVANRYSPPSPPRPSNFTRNPVTSRRGHGRRVDHYSPPRRSPRPGSPYNRYSAEPLDRERRSSNSRGSASASNSRGVSPDTRPYNARPMSPLPNQTIGRKRARDDLDNGGPPNRRSRYQGQESAHYVNGSARPPRVSSGNQFEEEWSRAAEYGRSPSPPYGAPLQARLDDRGNGPVAVQGSSHFGGTSYNHNRHSGKTKVIDDSGAPSLPLLNRLSDGDHLPPALAYSGTNRGPPRYRNVKPLPRAPHQPHEYRPNANKGTLIDRLQD